MTQRNVHHFDSIIVIEIERDDVRIAPRIAKVVVHSRDSLPRGVLLQVGMEKGVLLRVPHMSAIGQRIDVHENHDDVAVSFVETVIRTERGNA